MPKLSIVIPAAGAPSSFAPSSFATSSFATSSFATSSFEDTLVSVLENRPYDCEVLVVCHADYEDPYALEGEVRLVRLPTRRDNRVYPSTPFDLPWAVYLNAGLRHADASLVHTLIPGMRATPDWTTGAVDRMRGATRHTWAASPATEDQQGNVRSLGVSMSIGGMRKQWRHHHRLEMHRFGPHYAAGFYHRDQLRRLGGWCEAIHPALADLELALRASESGGECMLATDCRLVDDGVERLESQEVFRLARDLSRLYRRYLAPNGAIVRPFAMLGDVLLATSDLTCFSRTAGYLAGSLATAYQPPEASVPQPELSKPQAA